MVQPKRRRGRSPALVRRSRPEARRIPAAGSSRSGTSRRRRLQGRGWGSGVCGSCEVNSHPDPLFGPLRDCPDRSFRPKHRSLRPKPEIPGLGRKLQSDRIFRPKGPEFPAPPTQKCQVLLLNMQDARGASFQKGEVWDGTQSHWKWYFTLKLGKKHKENIKKHHLSVFSIKTNG